MSKKKFIEFIHLHKKQIIILGLILLLATVLRFYNFPDRWGMWNDDARDVAIAREAIERREFPMIGSFSSAGPFVFGPLFYWFLMGSLIIFNGLVYGPWIMTGLVGVATVFVFFLIGREIGGSRLGYITAFLTAISPQLAFRSMSLGQHTLVGITSALLLLFFILFWKSKKNWLIFWAGFSLGTALSMHYQALNLLLFFPLVLFVPQKTITKRIISSVVMFIGFLIPSLPLLIWDAQQGFANIINIMDYFLVGQHRLYVPNSWKLFIFQYFPNYWSFVVGAFTAVGFGLMILTGLVCIWETFKRRISGVLLSLGIVFFILFVVNRFYKGERSEGYLIYFAPFILLYTSWMIDRIFSYITAFSKKKKSSLISVTAKGFVMITLVLLTVLSLYKIIPSLQSGSRTKQFTQLVNTLQVKYPGKKFAVYDYTYRYSYHSQPLGLLLETKGLASKDGMKIGYTCSKDDKGNPCTRLPVINSSGDGVVLVDLQQEKNLSKWVGTNQDDMYDDLIGWSKKHELKSTFSIVDYVLHK